MLEETVSQKERSLDFRAVLDDRRILLCRLSQGAIGEENSYLLGSLIVSKLQQAALSRQEQQASARKPFFLYLDEFHHFVTPSLASLLSGVRKYGVGLTLAHQDLQQISGRDTDVAAAVLANPSTRVVFRVGDSDARKLEGGFSFFEASDLQSLAVGEAIARVERADFDFNLKTARLPEVDRSETANTRAAAREYSRAAYATPRAVVEAFIADQSREVADTSPRVACRAKGRVARPEATQGTEPAKSLVNSGDRQVAGPAQESPTSVASDPAPEDEQLDVRAGRGGAQHKYLQSLLRKLAEDRGYAVSVEREVLSGHGYIDVLLETAGVTIGCEISISTRPEHEVGNLTKCLAAGCDYAVLVSSNARFLERARELMAESAGDPRVRFATPTSFVTFLDSIGGASQTPRRDAAAKDARVGSATGATDGLLAAADAAPYIGLAKQTLAKFRVTGESPPYFKIGRQVYYKKADLDAWVAERRRRSTSDATTRDR